jgi:hypothetical protein
MNPRREDSRKIGMGNVPPGPFRQTVMYHGTCRAQIKIFRFITIYFGFDLTLRRWRASHATRWKFPVRWNPHCSQEKRHSIANP